MELGSAPANAANLHDQHIEAMLARFESQEQCAAEAPSAKYRAQGNQPTFDVPSEMHRILGVDLTAIPGMSAQGVLTFFCEVGPQITRFPSSRHFASWLGLCPDNRISGGKILSSKTRNVRCRLANALRMAATTLYRSHSALGDYFRRLRAKLGSPSAITAAAHKLARILFAMLRDRRSFDPQALGALNEKHLRRRQNSLRKYAASLGFGLVRIQNLARSVSLKNRSRPNSRVTRGHLPLLVRVLKDGFQGGRGARPYNMAGKSRWRWHLLQERWPHWAGRPTPRDLGARHQSVRPFRARYWRETRLDLSPNGPGDTTVGTSPLLLIRLFQQATTYWGRPSAASECPLRLE